MPEKQNGQNQNIIMAAFSEISEGTRMTLIPLPHLSLLAFKILRLRSFCVCEILFCHTNNAALQQLTV